MGLDLEGQKNGLEQFREDSVGVVFIRGDIGTLRHGMFQQVIRSPMQLFFFLSTFTLHLSHLADALIQSDLQIGAFTL